MTGMRHDRSLNRCRVISASGIFGTCKCKQVFSTLPNICFTFWILRKFKFMRIFIFMISISAVLKILNVLYQCPNYLYVLWNDMRYDVYNIVRWEIYTWFRVLIAIRSARFLTRDEDNLFYIVVYCNTLSFEITIKLRNYSVMICSTKRDIKFENFYQLASHMYTELPTKEIESVTTRGIRGHVHPSPENFENEDAWYMQFLRAIIVIILWHKR